MFSSIRQLFFPEEFRIAEPAFSKEKNIVMDQLLIALNNLNKDLLIPDDEKSDSKIIDVKCLSQTATGLWRLEKKMIDQKTKEPFEEMRKAYTHFESAWHALERAEVEVIDHTGELYDSGMSLNVIHFEPNPAIERETVIETINPTIYFKGQRIQMGEVIVGTPK